MAEIDSFLELLKKRRNIRVFKPDPLPQDYINKILEAGRWAMSGANHQPWEFIVVKDQRIKDGICEIMTEQSKSVRVIEMTRIEEVRMPWVERPVTGFPAFKDAPVYIVVCGDPRRGQAGVIGPSFLFGQDVGRFMMSLSNAIQNIHLAAAALGLGSEWVTVNYPSEERMKQLLKIPPVIRLAVVIPVGYRAKEPKPNYRRELADMVHYEQYDMAKYKSDEDIVGFLKELKQISKP